MMHGRKNIKLIGWETKFQHEIFTAVVVIRKWMHVT